MKFREHVNLFREHVPWTSSVKIYGVPWLFIWKCSVNLCKVDILTQKTEANIYRLKTLVPWCSTKCSMKLFWNPVPSKMTQFCDIYMFHELPWKMMDFRDVPWCSVTYICSVNFCENVKWPSSMYIPAKIKEEKTMKTKIKMSVHKLILTINNKLNK